MPLLHLHLLKLAPGVTTSDFVRQLQAERSSTQLILASLPHHWVVKPSKHDKDALLRQDWDLMLLLQTASNRGGELYAPLSQNIETDYVVPVGVPSKLLSTYLEKNAQLLRESPSVPLTGSLDRPLHLEPTDSQKLELSADLRAFMDNFTASHGANKPVTMLNLLCFKQGPGGKEEYAKYGQTFRTTGGRRGGDAKIVGNVIKDGKITEAAEWWNEVAIVHYPSIRHFCDMAAGEDYQDGNHKHRLPALEDTILLCTTEIPLTPTPKL